MNKNLLIKRCDYDQSLRDRDWHIKYKIISQINAAKDSQVHAKLVFRE